MYLINNKKKKYIYWTIYSILYCSVIQRYIFPNQLCQLIPDFLIIYVCIFQGGLINKISRQENLREIFGNLLYKVILIFFFVGIISSIINWVNPLSTIWGIRMLLRYSILFLLVYKNFDLLDTYKLINILNTSFYINALFVLLQFKTNSRGDDMGGIWMGNGDLSLYIIFMTIFFSSAYFNKKLKLKGYIFRIVFFYITSIWAEIKLLYFLLPLCILGAYLLFRKKIWKSIMILFIAWFFAIPIITNILSLYYDEDYVSFVLDVDQLEEYNNNNYGFTDESLNRGTIFEKSSIFLNSPIYLIIGHGIGSGTISSYFSTEVYEKYNKTCYAFFSMSYLLIEVGYTGLFLFILAHIILLYRFCYIYSHSYNVNIKYWSGLGILFTISTFIMIYYNSVPLNNYYFGYLFWAICAISIRDLKKLT